MPPRSPWSSPEDLIGQTLEQRYRVVRLLGEGGMGVVYEGLHVRLDKRVAIKVLHPHLATKERLAKRFLREARAANRIASPHVVEILDFGDDPITYFVMEFLEGRDLKAVIRKHTKLSWARTKPLMLQILRALAAAHEAGVVHRDVKPANVFVLDSGDSDDFAKVLDFGIAKVEKSSPQTRSITRTAEVFGSVAYMSPEQATGVEVDVRTDVYSAAVLFFEMLTGKTPFSGNNNYQLIDGHVRRAPPNPRSLESSIPEAVESIILQGLEKKPVDRFADMNSFIAAIESVPQDAEGPSVEESPPESTPTPQVGVDAGEPEPRRRGIGLAIGAVAAIGIGIVGANRLLESDPPDPATVAVVAEHDPPTAAPDLPVPQPIQQDPDPAPETAIVRPADEDPPVPDVPAPQPVSSTPKPIPKGPRRDSAILRSLSKRAATKCSVSTPVSVTFQVMHTGKTFLVKTQPKNDCVAGLIGAAAFRKRDKPERKSLTVG